MHDHGVILKTYSVGCSALLKPVFVLFLLFSSPNLFSQETARRANYSLASRFTPERIDKMVFDVAVEPRWLKSSERFWYRFETSEETSFFMVDPENKTKKPLFDNEQVATALTAFTKKSYDPKQIPIEKRTLDSGSWWKPTFSDERIPTFSDYLEFVKQETAFQFVVDSLVFEYDLGTTNLALIDSFKSSPQLPGWASLSPDSSTIVFARKHNLYLMKADDPDSLEHRLTMDGEKFYSYENVMLRDMLFFDYYDGGPPVRRQVRITWSKDSQKFFLIRHDAREVDDLWLVNPLSEPRPTLEAYKYPLPGEENMWKREIHIFDREKKTHVKIKSGRWKDEFYRNVKWGDSSNSLYFTRVSRDVKKYDVCVADAGTGEVRVLIEERSQTSTLTRPFHVINDGSELIHWSERDDWGHFYLYSGQGVLRNRITSGPYFAIAVAKIDTANRVLYFTACGREQGRDPYYAHLYRVGFDGQGLKLLSPEDATHSVAFSPSARYFVDNYSRVDNTPKSVLRDTQGKSIFELETADLSVLRAEGFQFPEPFRVKAADEETDLYGVMWKPFDFDPKKRYPILAWVYPGPQTESVPKSFSGALRHVGMAQFGFIVITSGHRGGHPHRSKSYHRFAYGSLMQNGIVDKKVTIEQLAKRHSFIDKEKVGMFGHSGGANMTATAMMTYPDFFKVGVASSGNHDHRIYHYGWAERNHGIEEVVAENGETTFKFDIPTNMDLADNLKGRLLLITGAIDNNVNPAITFRMADALIQANKRFDFFVFPGKRHSYSSMRPYIFWLTGDYFCKHLLGDSDNRIDIQYINENEPK